MTDLDRLIDDAAKDMTAASAPVDLRARVTRELLEPTTEVVRRRPVIWPWLAAAAGLILAAYLGLAVRGDRSEDRPLQDQAIVRDNPGSVPGGSSQGTSRVEGPVRPAHSGNAIQARGQRAATPRAPEPTITSIPALETPAAIRIEPLDAAPRPVPALDTVAPLGIEQLNITPLTPPGQAAGGQ